MQIPPYLDLGFGLTRIDTGLDRPGFAACYLMEHQGRLAIIETGARHTITRILDFIEERGFSYNDVEFVIITHVHLDHAGGAGGLMRKLPNARLVVHPLGARHMQDPSKLQAGAMAVYGEERYMKDYGDLLPVSPERMLIKDDGDSVKLGDRILKFIDTPGHARHHFCVYDSYSGGIFSGDTLGIVYSELCGPGGPFVIPTTTPVQFDPMALKASIDRLLALQPDLFFLTHFGMVDASQGHADKLKAQIDDYVKIAFANKHVEEKRVARIMAALLAYTLDDLQRQGCLLPSEQLEGLLANDMMLNAQGLDVWLQKTEPITQNGRG